MRVAAVPKMISRGAPASSIFVRRQPSVTPGIAAGVKAARTHSASGSLIWIAYFSNPKESQMRARTTYAAAKRADVVNERMAF